MKRRSCNANGIFCTHKVLSSRLKMRDKPHLVTHQRLEWPAPLAGTHQWVPTLLFQPDFPCPSCPAFSLPSPSSAICSSPRSIFCRQPSCSVAFTWSAAAAAAAGDVVTCAVQLHNTAAASCAVSYAYAAAWYAASCSTTPATFLCRCYFTPHIPLTF